MTIQLRPSLQNPFGLVWSGDSALARPILTGVDEAAEKEALATWENRMRVARETGNYGDVCYPEAKPTIFRMAPLGRTANDALMDAIGQRRIGRNAVATLAFRLCLRGVEGIATGGEGFKVEFEIDPITGMRALKADLADDLDVAAPGVCHELGAYMLDRAMTPGK